MKNLRLKSISRLQVVSSIVSLLIVFLIIGFPSEHAFMQEAAEAQETSNDELESESATPPQPTCADTINDNKFVGGLSGDAANPCSGFCGSINVGYGWALISIAHNCVDANGNSLPTPPTLTIDHDGLHSGYCISFNGQIGASCTPTAQLKCIEDDGTVVNHTIQKSLPVPEPMQECECQCQMGGVAVEPSPTNDECGAEVNWINPQDCVNQSPTNCGGAPIQKMFITSDADPCTGSSYNIECVLDQDSGKCTIAEGAPVNFGLRTSYFLDCKDPQINQGKDCKDCECGIYIDGANGPVRLVDPVYLLAVMIIEQRYRPLYSCALAPKAATEEQPLFP